MLLVSEGSPDLQPRQQWSCYTTGGDLIIHVGKVSVSLNLIVDALKTRSHSHGVRNLLPEVGIAGTGACH